MAKTKPTHFLLSIIRYDCMSTIALIRHELNYKSVVLALHYTNTIFVCLKIEIVKRMGISE